MMSSSDLFIEGYPHGTPKGYDDGCRGAVCPAGIEYGLSCKIAKQKSRGDYQYQQLVKKGATLAEIADALGLVGSEPGAPKPKTAKLKATPATAHGGRSLADAAEAASAGAEKLVEAVVELDQQIQDPSITPLDQARQIRELVGPLRREDGTLNTRAIAEEATLRQNAGLPAWIAELDAPKDYEQAEPANPGEATAPAPTPREIREWARDRGYEIGTKGKIPQHIVDHYWEATGRLDAPADEMPSAIAEHVKQLEDELTDLLPPESRPEWAQVTLHEDLEAARNLAVRLEQELAHVEQQHDTLTQVYSATMNDHAHASSEDLRVIEDLARRLDQAEAERDSANHALELAVRKWGDERAANEASYAVILDQAATINRLTALATITPDVEASMDNALRNVLTHALRDGSLKFRDRLRVMKQLADLGPGKAHTR